MSISYHLILTETFLFHQIIMTGENYKSFLWHFIPQRLILGSLRKLSASITNRPARESCEDILWSHSHFCLSLERTIERMDCMNDRIFLCTPVLLEKTDFIVKKLLRSDAKYLDVVGRSMARIERHPCWGW